MVTKAVVLCGGLATRFLPYSKAQPKEMLTIVDKPIIDYIIEELYLSGIKEVLIIVGRGKESIINYFDKNIELENALIKSGKFKEVAQLNKIHSMLKIYYTRQIEPKGTGHCIKLAKEWVKNEPFVLLYGDEIFYNEQMSRTQQLIDGFNKAEQSIIAVKPVPMSEVHKYGIIKTDRTAYKKESENLQFATECSNGKMPVNISVNGLNATAWPINKQNILKVLRIVEKPDKKNAPGNLSYIGAGVFNGDIFKYTDKLPDTGGEILVTDALNEMAQAGELNAIKLAGERFDVGDAEGFLKANIFMGLKSKKYRDSLKEFIKELLPIKK